VAQDVLMADGQLTRRRGAADRGPRGEAAGASSTSEVSFTYALRHQTAPSLTSIGLQEKDRQMHRLDVSAETPARARRSASDRDDTRYQRLRRRK
jgi:hypothetical protein